MWALSRRRWQRFWTDVSLKSFYKRCRDLAHRPGVHWLAAPIYRKGKSSPAYLKNRLTALLKRSVRERDEGARAKLLRKWVWLMNRSYRSSERWTIAGAEEFAAVLGRIATGERISASEILPYLCLESRAQRSEVNALLADAYAQTQTAENLEQAKVFIQRAWILSGGSAELLPLYTKIFSALKDTASIRDAYKRLGMKAAAQKNISEAIRYFTSAHIAYALFEHLDKFEYDFDILSSMDELAAPHRFHKTTQTTFPEGGKIRLAHLVKGAAELNSILVTIDLVLAKFYDKSRFDVTFFIPETEEVIDSSPQGKAHIEKFESLGWKVATAPNLDSQEEVLLALARKIHESQPHILVTSAALADYRHYFITSLRPAPISIGLVQGPPQQFAPPILDWSIGWTKHPLMDTPVDCTWVDIKLDYPMQSAGEAHDRATLGLPEDACVLMSGGRYSKFQSREFWEAIISLLAQHPHTYFVAVGPYEHEIPVLNSILPKPLKARVKCLGWREDFLRILPAADILIDTYPSGGGQVIVQAMASGIPFVSHRNDYMKLFEQTNWNPVEDFITDEEIIVPRGDFEQVKRVISRLIEDEKYRAEVGERCLAAHVRRADPQHAVRQCEEVYTRVLKMFSARAASA